MKAAIVLLAPPEIQNYARRHLFQLNTRYGVGFYASILPAHVSLKQTFTFESMDTLEPYFDTLAASIPPFEVQLDRLYCEEWTGFGILGLKVVETPYLRRLHNRLNQDLAGIVKDSSSPHDGDGYRFHLTIEMGKVGATNPFKEYFDSLQDKTPNLTFTAREIAMFYYPDPALPPCTLR